MVVGKHPMGSHLKAAWWPGRLLSWLQTPSKVFRIQPENTSPSPFLSMSNVKVSAVLHIATKAAIGSTITAAKRCGER